MSSHGWTRRTVFDSLTMTEKRMITDWVNAKQSGNIREFKQQFINKHGYARYNQIERYGRMICRK